MAEHSFLTRDAVRDVYDRRARFYDLAVWGYYLMGMPIGKWRRMGVEALELQPGDTVVEVGCGTGLNFALLQKAIGPDGKIVGIDISENMLDRARSMVRDKDWRNVELVSGSVSEFEFPVSVGGIIAMGVLTYWVANDGLLKPLRATIREVSGHNFGDFSTDRFCGVGMPVS
jgi:demethylmenaquinone methyltransferase/2-methoxy-6-polyprenyl-1,4-benzoquinol methylase